MQPPPHPFSELPRCENALLKIHVAASHSPSLQVGEIIAGGFAAIHPLLTLAIGTARPIDCVRQAKSGNHLVLVHANLDSSANNTVDLLLRQKPSRLDLCQIGRPVRIGNIRKRRTTKRRFQHRCVGFSLDLLRNPFRVKPATMQRQRQGGDKQHFRFHCVFPSLMNSGDRAGRCLCIILLVDTAALSLEGIVLSDTPGGALQDVP